MSVEFRLDNATCQLFWNSTDKERLKDGDFYGGDVVDDDDEDDSVTLVVDGGVESRIDVSETQGREEHSAPSNNGRELENEYNFI